MARRHLARPRTSSVRRSLRLSWWWDNEWEPSRAETTRLPSLHRTFWSILGSLVQRMAARNNEESRNFDMLDCIYTLFAVSRGAECAFSH